MALVPIAKQGHFLHIYDFRVKEGHTDDFIAQFNEFDYSDRNPMHKSPYQVTDGVLVQDTADPLHFWLIGEWKSVEEHARIRKIVAEMKPQFVSLVTSGPFIPHYGLVVSSTPQEVLDRAAAQSA
jgi:quinol monooxygenase YgiN